MMEATHIIKPDGCNALDFNVKGSLTYLGVEEWSTNSIWAWFDGFFISLSNEDEDLVVSQWNSQFSKAPLAVESVKPEQPCTDESYAAEQDATAATLQQDSLMGNLS